MALMSLIAIVLFCAVSLEPCFTVWRSSRLEFKGNVDGTDVDGGKTRDLDWAEWIDSNHPVTIDGNPSDWSSYTPHPIGTGSNVVNVYIANDNSHLSICIDAVSDVTDNEQTGDKIQGFIDGDNDNTAPTWISESEANMNSRDNWFTLCGDRDKASDDTDAYNDAGLINKRNNGDTVLWYNQGTWIDEWGYQWATGFNGQPAHMVYEIKIPFSKWSWNPGDPIGIAFEAAKAQGGGSSLIGKYPGGFSINNMGSFRDIRLATQNDRPYYSNPKANPSTISNDGVNETLLTVEAMDSDGSVSSVQIDLTSIGGGSSVNMMDDGNNGDQTAGDDIYSYRTTVSTTALAETKELDFVIFDDHTPNVGSARGEIRLTVIQANRPPEIAPSPTQRITLLEDQDEAYLELRDNVFSDPDYPDDVLTYLMKTNTSWESQCTTPLATYRILMNDSIKVEPLPDRHGTETVLLTATDAEGLGVDAPFSLTVVIQPTNDPPHITTVNGTEILFAPVNLDAWEDLWTEYNFFAIDIDGDDLEYSLNISDRSDKFKKNTDYVFYGENGTFKIGPKNSHVGEYDLKLTVEDGNGGEDDIDVCLKVINTNDPPRMDKISTMYVDQDELLEYTPVVRDDDLLLGTDSLTFTTNLSEQLKGHHHEDNFSFDPATGALRFRPNKYMIKTYYTHIRVEDDHRAFHQRDFKIIVIDSINDPPEKPTFEVLEGGTDNLTVLFKAGTVSDPDGDKILYEWDFDDRVNPPLSPDLGEVSHVFSEAGVYNVKLTLSDGYEYSEPAILQVVVTAPPDGGEPGEENLRITGKVTTSEGAPLDYAIISIELVDDPAVKYDDMTDSEGRFSLKVLEGKYNVTARKDGFISNWHVVIIGPGDEGEFTLQLKPVDISSENPSGSESFISRNLLFLLGAVFLFILSIIFLIVVARKKRRKKDDVPVPHHIMPPPARPPMRPPPRSSMPQPPPRSGMPPALQYKSLPPAPPAKMPPSQPGQFSPEALKDGSIPVSRPGHDPSRSGKPEPTLPPGKRPAPEVEPEIIERPEEIKETEGVKETEGIKETRGGRPKIVKLGTPRPPNLSGNEGNFEGLPGEDASIEGSPPLLPAVKDTAETSPERSPAPTSAEPGMEYAEPTSSRSSGAESFSELFDLGEAPASSSPSIPGTFDPEPEEHIQKQSPKNILKELSSEEDVEQEVGGSPSISGIFDGLDGEAGSQEPPAKETKGALAKIPVKRMAISRETGERLSECEVCGGYYSSLEAECPHCGGAEEKIGAEPCPSCGAKVGSDMIFCNKCGSNLRKVKAVRTDEDTVKKARRRVECPTCGKMLHRDMKFCNACGTPAKGKPKARSSKKKAGPEKEEYLEHVECYNCGNMMPVTTRERPVIVSCPHCGTQGQLA